MSRACLRRETGVNEASSGVLILPPPETPSVLQVSPAATRRRSSRLATAARFAESAGAVDGEEFFMPERVFLELFSTELSIFETSFRNFKRQVFLALDSHDFTMDLMHFIYQNAARVAHTNHQDAQRTTTPREPDPVVATLRHSQGTP